MRKTFAYFISLSFLSWAQLGGQDTAEPPDTVEILLKIRAAIEVTGHVIYFFDKEILNIEGYLLADLNEKRSLFLGGGYSDYRYSQYNYNFLSSGIFIKAGADFNLLKPEKSAGKYWAGIGIHYGLSAYKDEVPSFLHENYWGSASSSVGQKSYLGHFIEASPGFRAEIFKYFTIGWSVSLRKLISAGTGKDLRPVYLPGYGAGAKSFSTGINYFIIFNIPYRKIKVEIKPEPVEEPVE
jgi:hypothetical protein